MESSPVSVFPKARLSLYYNGQPHQSSFRDGSLDGFVFFWRLSPLLFKLWPSRPRHHSPISPYPEQLARRLRSPCPGRTWLRRAEESWGLSPERGRWRCAVSGRRSAGCPSHQPASRISAKKRKDFLENKFITRDLAESCSHWVLLVRTLSWSLGNREQFGSALRRDVLKDHHQLCPGRDRGRDVFNVSSGRWNSVIRSPRAALKWSRGRWPSCTPLLFPLVSRPPSRTGCSPRSSWRTTPALGWPRRCVDAAT